VSNGQTVSAERLCYIFTMRATTWLSQKRRRKRVLRGSMTYDGKRKGKQQQPAGKSYIMHVLLSVSANEIRRKHSFRIWGRCTVR
jgi:hypothetical protein